MNDEYDVCKVKRVEGDGEKENIVPGELIGVYKSPTMLPIGKNITLKSKKYRVKCIDFNTKKGRRIALVE